MKKLVLHILMVFWVQEFKAQYDYFNSINGINEGAGDIEVLGDYFYIMGAGQIDGEDCWFFRKLDEEGNEVDQSCFFFPGQFHFLGTTKSFQKIPGDDAFLHTQGFIEGNAVKGFALKINSDLDTVWTRVFDQYNPETYFTTHTWDGDGFILAGEHGPEAGERGTFIMKIDTLGNVLWHNLIHAPWEGVFRNRDISVVEGGYVWSGASGLLENTEGQLEYISENGVLQYTLYGEGGLQRSSMRHFRISNDSVVTFQPIISSYLSGNSGPSYRVVRLSVLDISIPQLITLVDFEPYPNWINGYGVKMVKSEEGLVMMGQMSIQFGTSFNTGSFLCKLNNDFSTEWYTELFYDDCPSCENILYDMELAPDGGYVMVGTFTDTSIDFNPRTWLVKVDACGDLEWQGCEPVGIGEFEMQSRNDGMKLEIWPNPYPAGSSAPLGVRFPQEVIVEKVVMVDAKGSIIGLSIESLRFEVSAHSETNFKLQAAQLQTLPHGLYTLLITTKDGAVYSGKVIVE